MSEIPTITLGKKEYALTKLINATVAQVGELQERLLELRSLNKKEPSEVQYFQVLLVWATEDENVNLMVEHYSIIKELRKIFNPFLTNIS